MTRAYRKNRKNSDEDIIRLNSLGLSLNNIAYALNCHATSITLRLQALKIPAADTRRAFMDGVLLKMSGDEQNALADHLHDNPGITIKDYVRDLILQDIRVRVTEYNQAKLVVESSEDAG